MVESGILDDDHPLREGGEVPVANDPLIGNALLHLGAYDHRLGLEDIGLKVAFLLISTIGDKNYIFEVSII